MALHSSTVAAPVSFYAVCSIIDVHVSLALFFSCVDWMYIINEDDNRIIKLHKPTGALAQIEVEDLENNGSKLYGLKVYSKHEQPIDNTHPCSIAANYGGCQKLCFAVPSNKSKTSSLQAVCGCPSDEKVGSGGKTCSVVRSGGASKRIQYRFVTTFSLLLVCLFTI